MPKPHLALIPSLGTSSFEDVVYRVVGHRLKDNILSTEGNRYFSGRYHLEGETGILYASRVEQTAVQEIARHADRQSLRETLVVGKIKLRLQKVLDLTQPRHLQKLGLSKEDLVSNRHSITQAISLQARRAGIQGLIVPSATGQGNNLIVFENNLGEGCSIQIEEIREIA